jgi:excisionase family DNA binding protein
MDELLTTRQVQQLLKVDRITVYRMLKDGRLKGMKVGNQWRFPRTTLEALFPGQTASPQEIQEPKSPPEVLPIHCLQVIQDVFAEIAEIGSVTTDAQGLPLTEISNSCDFCDLILESPSGRQACIASWKQLAQTPASDPEFLVCHAGLQYARGRIEVEDDLTGILVGGQFNFNQPDPQEQAERVTVLAEAHGVDPLALQQATESIRLLSPKRQAQITNWLTRVAVTFEDIGQERAYLLDRLKQIAAMSTLELDLL